jgi:hypothetical protein
MANEQTPPLQVGGGNAPETTPERSTIAEAQNIRLRDAWLRSQDQSPEGQSAALARWNAQTPSRPSPHVHGDIARLEETTRLGSDGGGKNWRDPHSHPPVKVETTRGGNPRFDALSEDQATRLADALLANGVDPQRVKEAMGSNGFEETSVDTDTLAARREHGLGNAFPGDYHPDQSRAFGYGADVSGWENVIVTGGAFCSQAGLIPSLGDNFIESFMKADARLANMQPAEREQFLSQADARFANPYRPGDTAASADANIAYLIGQVKASGDADAVKFADVLAGSGRDAIRADPYVRQVLADAGKRLRAFNDRKGK